MKMDIDESPTYICPSCGHTGKALWKKDLECAGCWEEKGLRIYVDFQPVDSKGKGLCRRYVVTKVTNPSKNLDCIVLEFDDPIARAGIVAWAHAMKENGYEKAHDDTMKRVKYYEELERSGK